MAASLALLPRAARAQDLEPRAYANTPVGMSFLVLAYAYSSGGVAPDATVPLENADIRLHTEALALAHSFSLLGKSAKFDVIVPVAELSGSALYQGSPVQRDIDGFGDQKFRLSWNFFGAPALTLAEHEHWKQDLIIGSSLQVTAPGGQYDEDRLVNLGSHRWVFKPELGVSKALGPFTIEGHMAMSFYTDNEKWLRTKSREQDPLLALQLHAIWSAWRGIWLALDTTWYTGGATTVDGVENDDNQGNLRVGGTLALPITRHQSLKLYASGAALTLHGNEFTTVGVAWQYRWGGGL